MSGQFLKEDMLVDAVERAVGVPDGVLSIFAGAVKWTEWAEFKVMLEADEGECRLGRLLEMRAYDAESEFHAQRDALGKHFMWRYIRDADFAKDEKLDDVQYLDIDAKKSRGTSYVATGGGAYKLPVADATKVRLRNYLEYGSDGMATVVDFRIVGLECRGGQNG